MDKIIIIGGKGSAVVIAEQIYDNQVKIGDVEFLGFAFDDKSFGNEINGFPILAGTRNVYDIFGKYDDVKYIYALYRPDLIKERIVLRDSYNIPLDKWANFVHHSAFVAKSVQMGYGNVVLANSVLNSGVVLGNYNTIHSNVLIGHDTVIGNSTFITGHCAVGSNNKIGDGCFIGLNSSLNNYISIGNYVFVGMASNVIKTVPDDVMVYGNPARPTERKIKPL